MNAAHICPVCGKHWQCTNTSCIQTIVPCFACSPIGSRTYSPRFGQSYQPQGYMGKDFVWTSIDEAQELSEEDMEKTLFYIKVKSNFIPTMTAVKQKLGVGHEVVSVEGVKDFPGGITNTETALGAIINTGYKELIRRYHPDVAVKVDPDVIRHLTAAKKQLDELLKRIA